MADLLQQEWAEGLANDSNAVILDVRTEEEFSEGMIPNAINLNIFRGQAFVYEVDALDKEKSYYVYCRSGGRSGQACTMMNELGFTKAYNLIGGFSEWQGDSAIPEQ